MQTVPLNCCMKNIQTPEMCRDNAFTQTQQIQHFEAGKNTNSASNRVSQTQQTM